MTATARRPTDAPRGRVCFVGAGPGSADLVTLRGAARLAAADVVVADALADPALRELAPQARWIDAGKRGFRAATDQRAIDARLVREAQRGRLVVRLKGGDPSVFGRLEEEIAALDAAGVAFEIVPGVTAALAAAADAQRPLTRRGRGRSVALASAMTASGRLQGDRAADTTVYYMAGRQLAALSRTLRAAGWEAATPVCVVSRAGWPDAIVGEHTVATLGEAVLLHAGRPTVVTVGCGAVRVAADRASPDDAESGSAPAAQGRDRARATGRAAAVRGDTPRRRIAGAA